MKNQKPSHEVVAPGGVNNLDSNGYDERSRKEVELLEKPGIVEDNKLLILKFKWDLIAEGMGIVRIARYMQTLA